MMKKIVFAVALFTVMSSCQKENSDQLRLNGKKELLTAKEWVVLKVEERENGGVWEDVFPQFAPCLKDNRFKFKTDFKLEYSEGPVACVPNTPNQVLETETWKFNADETVLITGGVENKIIQLEAGKLVVVITETVGGVTYETRNTYGH